MGGTVICVVPSQEGCRAVTILGPRTVARLSTRLGNTRPPSGEGGLLLLSRANVLGPGLAPLCGSGVGGVFAARGALSPTTQLQAAPRRCSLSELSPRGAGPDGTTACGVESAGPAPSRAALPAPSSGLARAGGSPSVPQTEGMCSPSGWACGPAAHSACARPWPLSRGKADDPTPGLGELELFVVCAEGCQAAGFSAANGIHLTERTGGPCWSPGAGAGISKWSCPW